MKNLKTVLIGLSVFPMAVIFYFLYIHVVSLLDPFLSIVIGGGFALALLIGVIIFLLNIKDFIVSIFKKDKGVDKNGFTKF